MPNEIETSAPSITIKPKGDGGYSDLLTVCQFLRDKYGSSANALAQLAQSSPEFADALAHVRETQEATNAS